jgi:CheY-like chemotaxis protein
MSMKEKMDVLDFLINILKEHEENLNEITQKLETLSQAHDSRMVAHEHKMPFENVKKEVEGSIPKSNILIVDDDEFLTETFKVILETVGYNVEIATSGMQAIEITSERKFDLVFMDIKLPDINGDEVAHVMNKQGKNTKIVMITGYEKLAERLKDDPVNVQEVLIKPVSPNNIIAMTQKALLERR